MATLSGQPHDAPKMWIECGVTLLERRGALLESHFYDQRECHYSHGMYKIIWYVRKNLSTIMIMTSSTLYEMHAHNRNIPKLCLKSPATRPLFNIERNTNTPHHRPFVREIHRWSMVRLTKDQWYGNMCTRNIIRVFSRPPNNRSLWRNTKRWFFRYHA